MWITHIAYSGMNFISMNFFHLRLKQGNNDAERALQDMMGGKLEQKKEEVIVDTELERPAWMHGNPKNFTKEQIKDMKEFDAKLKVNNQYLTKIESCN